MTKQPVLSVRNLSKQYRRRPVFSGVSFSVAPGEAIAVLGSNGAGKSTLLGCTTGDRLPTSGDVRVCGVDPFSDPATLARCIGVVPEQPFLYGELTLGEMLGFVREVRRPYAPDVDSELVRLLDLLGLAGEEMTLCRELSQGMARKTAIIAALLHRPRLIVLDEAFNGLDRPSAEALSGELRKLMIGGAAILLSSHDLTLLAGICGRGLFVHDGGVETLEGGAWERWRASPTLTFIQPGTRLA